MHDRNITAPIIHFVNYQPLSHIGLPVWGPRRLTDFELILSLRGEFEFQGCETGETVTQHPNEVLVIRPGESHIYRLKNDRNDAFFSCIHLEPGAEGSFLNGDYQLELPPRLIRFGTEHAIAELFRRADYLFHHPGRRSNELLSAVGKLIWLYLFEVPDDDGCDDRLDAMIEYLDTHLVFHPTRLDLAREFHLTPQRVNAIFKRALNRSPGDYVRRELAERGYALIHDEQLSIKEAADRLGFSSQFYFSRVFKQVFGVPPSSV